MYRITVASKVGDYVIDNAGEFIYEITGVSISISFNEELGKEEIRLLFEGVDAKDPEGPFYLINGHEVRPATDEEVDSYILDDYESLEKLFDEEPEEEIVEQSSEEYDSTKKKQDDVPTIDDLLDKYIDYKALIEIVGDEDGVYKNKLIELEEKMRNYNNYNINKA